MSSEENYLDDLLNHVLEPKPAEPMNEVQVAETNAEQDIQDDLRISDIEELEPEASEQNSEITELEMPELEDIELEALNIEENGADALQISDIEPEMPEPNELETPEPEAIQPEIPELEELEATQPEIPELEELEATQPNTPDLEDLEEPHTELSEQDDPLDIEIPDIDTDKELSLEDNKMPEDDELKLEDIELSELEAEMPLAESELNIDGLDEAIQSETELEMAGELNIDELDFGDETAKEDHFDVEIPDLEMPDIPDSEDFDMSMENASAFPELSDAAELLKENAKANEGEASATMEDNLEDVLNMLDDDELAGVIGHELAHIYGKDILIGTIVAMMAGTIMTIVDIFQWSMILGGGNSDNEDGNPLGFIGSIAMIILAPLAATLIQMAVSRSREYIADQRGAEFCGNPKALASALHKIAYGIEMHPMAEAKPATAHMFIANPFAGQKMMSLFSTHPPIDDRINKLVTMANSRSGRAY